MLAFVVAPQIKGSTNLQQSLTITTSDLRGVGAGLYFFTFLTAKEQVQRDVAKCQHPSDPSEPAPQQTAAHALPLQPDVPQRPSSTGTVAAFYTRNVLGNANYFIITSIMQTIGVFAAAFSVPRFVRTLGKKNSYLLGGVVAIVGRPRPLPGPALDPGHRVPLLLVLGVGLGLVNTLMWAFEADTVEYGEWTSGVRTEGITYAAFSFTRKMGQAVGGAAAASTIGLRWLRRRCPRPPDQLGIVLDQARRWGGPSRLHHHRDRHHGLLPADRHQVPRDRPRDGRAPSERAPRQPRRLQPRSKPGGPSEHAREGFSHRAAVRRGGWELLAAECAGLPVDGKRVLVLIPDGTRHAPIPLLFRLLYELLGNRVARLDYLIALGTHPPMPDALLRSWLACRRLSGPNAIPRLRSSTMPGTKRMHWRRSARSSAPEVERLTSLCSARTSR